MFRQVRAGSKSRLTTIDSTETYGRHVLEEVCKILDVSLCLDLGCGWGDDLAIVKKQHPGSRCLGVDYGDWGHKALIAKGIEPLSVNIETECLPLADESVDFVIANQVLEHTKEIFWINHEVFRTLKVGGHFYLGVPNVLSLHNRILGLLGIHPTASKIISAHVRSFSKADTLLYYREIAARFCSVKGFYGAQFYPFPKPIARLLSRLFPSLAFSIFFLIRKTSPYNGEFIDWIKAAPLETNYFIGE